METIPTDLKLELLKLLADTGQTFQPLICASKSFHAVYCAYAQQLDEALVDASVGHFLPFAWLIQEESGGNKEAHLEWQEKVDVKTFTMEERHRTYRTHVTILAVGLQMGTLARDERKRICGRFDSNKAPDCYSHPDFLLIIYSLILTDYNHDDFDLIWKESYFCFARSVFPKYNNEFDPHPWDILDDFIQTEGIKNVPARFLKAMEDGEIDSLVDWTTTHFMNNLEGLYKFTRAYDGQVTGEQQSLLLEMVDNMEKMGLFNW